MRGGVCRADCDMCELNIMKDEALLLSLFPEPIYNIFTIADCACAYAIKHSLCQSLAQIWRLGYPGSSQLCALLDAPMRQLHQPLAVGSIRIRPSIPCVQQILIGRP